MTWKTIGVMLVVAAPTLASACSSETRGVDLGERGGPSDGFGPGKETDAGGGDPPAQLLCATSECPAGTTTCETSRARCDIDFENDRDNCGACGAACPPDSHWGGPGSGEGPFLEVAFLCVEGKCQMQCQNGYGDCDGIPDNGCETSLRWKDNCGACGVKCADNEPCTDGVCGCPSPRVNCDGYCADVRTDYQNCGACENACNDPDPYPYSFHYYMQCLNGTCDRACEGGWGDCDDDIPTNGCEQRLNTNEHCGVCGNACPSGTECERVDDVWQCGCPAPLRKCEVNGNPRCLDILTDPNNCGGCNVQCQSVGEGDLRLADATYVCRSGVCDMICKNGLADCNGFSGDGCEINLETDPHHCGACGHECDLAIGQPCVKGECVTTACTGEESR